MELAQFLLNKFNNQKIKYYDEAIIESEIIVLENKLRLVKNIKEVEKIYQLIIKKYDELCNMKNLRLINYILECVK